MPRSRTLPHNFFDDAVPFKIDGVYCKAIPLTRGLIAIVELADYGHVAIHKWYAWPSSRRTYYATRHAPGVKGATTSLHRELMGNPDELKVDHENQNSLDDRRKNLRIATGDQNSSNSIRLRSTNSSGYRGVCFVSRDRKYLSRITCKRTVIRIGYFLTAIQAAKARDAEAVRLHGRFAVLNFPEDYNT